MLWSEGQAKQVINKHLLMLYNRAEKVFHS